MNCYKIWKREFLSKWVFVDTVVGGLEDAVNVAAPLLVENGGSAIEVKIAKWNPVKGCQLGDLVYIPQFRS